MSLASRTQPASQQLSRSVLETSMNTCSPAASARRLYSISCNRMRKHKDALHCVEPAAAAALPVEEAAHEMHDSIQETLVELQGPDQARALGAPRAAARVAPAAAAGRALCLAALLLRRACPQANAAKINHPSCRCTLSRSGGGAGGFQRGALQTRAVPSCVRLRPPWAPLVPSSVSHPSPPPLVPTPSAGLCAVCRAVKYCAACNTSQNYSQQHPLSVCRVLLASWHTGCSTPAQHPGPGSRQVSNAPACAQQQQ